MAKRNPNKPEPVPWGPMDGETLATAYARLPPGKRQGKEHWTWELSFKDGHGKRRTRSLGRLPRELVWGAITKVMQEVDPSSTRPDGSDVLTVGDLLRRYYRSQENRDGGRTALAERTLLSYLHCCKRIMPVAGHTLLTDLDEATVFRIREALLSTKRDGSHPGYAPKTVKADIKFLRQAILWGRSMGVTVPDVSTKRAVKFAGTKAKEPVNNKHTPSEEDVALLYQHIRQSKTKLAMYIMWQTGCRIGECARLRWRHITHSEDGAWVSFPEGKTGPRRTPITVEAFGEIQSYRPAEATDDSRLFNSPGQMSSNTGAAIAQACQIRNIEPFTSHGLRRLFTRRCMRAGVDVGTYACMAGHSPEIALRDYDKPTPEDMLAALRRMMQPDARDLIRWLRQNEISEAEAMRVLEDWQSKSVRQRKFDGDRSGPGALGASASDGVEQVFEDDSSTSPSNSERVVH